MKICKGHHCETFIIVICRKRFRRNLFHFVGNVPYWNSGNRVVKFPEISMPLSKSRLGHNTVFGISSWEISKFPKNAQNLFSCFSNDLVSVQFNIAFKLLTQKTFHGIFFERMHLSVESLLYQVYFVRLIKVFETSRERLRRDQVCEFSGVVFDHFSSLYTKIQPLKIRHNNLNIVTHVIC